MIDLDKSKGHKLRVAVLMGGTSSEREVSLSTGRMIAASLDPGRYDVVAIDTKDLIQLSPPSKQIEETRRQGDKETREEGKEVEGKDLIQNPKSQTQNHPDLVFIALHGRGGEDGAVQGLLEVLRLPYTGSGILASALAMDKAMSKRLFRGAGIPVGAEITLRRDYSLSMDALIAQIQDSLGGFPVFVKPNAEGSTVGGTLVSSPAQLADALAHAFRYDNVILIERYLRGMEATVGVLGNAGSTLQALPVIEIVPKSEFYDYESKYAEGGSEHIIPARLTDAQTQQLQQIALRCHTLLGCRGMSRADFIVTPEGPYVLEINTIPGMTPTSLLPQAAAHAGIPFPALLDHLIALALEP
jgi:D-alanine-D-alanine ligase